MCRTRTCDAIYMTNVLSTTSSVSGASDRFILVWCSADTWKWVGISGQHGTESGEPLLTFACNGAVLSSGRGSGIHSFSFWIDFGLYYFLRGSSIYRYEYFFGLDSLLVVFEYVVITTNYLEYFPSTANTKPCDGPPLRRNNGLQCTVGVAGLCVFD